MKQGIIGICTRHVDASLVVTEKTSELRLKVRMVGMKGPSAYVWTATWRRAAA